MARAFVLGLNSRAVLAVGIVAMSVAYAVLAGAAAGGLKDAGAVFTADLLAPREALHAPGLAPFEASLAPPGSVLLTHSPWQGGILGTVRPWPHDQQAVPGPYARAAPAALAALGLPVADPRAHDLAPWDWVLVPPEVFEEQFPELAGRATIALAPPGAAAAGLRSAPVPAAAAFYERGAEQVTSSIHLVVAAMALSVAVFAGGVLRLEILARERDLATLEALGGTTAARRAVVLRAVFLVGLGVALGAAAGWGLARYAARALGAGALRLDPLFVLEVAAVAHAAGLAAGALGGLARLRAPVGERLGRRGVAARRFPGPVRFLLVTPRLLPSAVAAALVLASVGSVVLAAASVPFTVLDPQDGTFTVGRAPDNPFRGTADRFLGEHALALDGINGSSPETLAPTLLDGRPVMVRGVHLQGWRGVDPVRLASGAWPADPDEATAGTRLARVSGLAVGDTVVVPGAYRLTLRALRVVGLHEGAGLLDDELVTGLDAAGDLAALSPSQVHLLRLRGAPEAVDAALAVDRPVVAGLRVEPPEPVPRTIAEAEVRLVNFLPGPASRTLALRVDGVLAVNRVAAVPGHAEVAVRMPFLVPEGERFLVEVNPAVNVTTSEPGLRVRAPESVATNTTFEVEVARIDGTPAAGAAVQAGDQERTADAEGKATFLAGEPGVLAVSARLGALEGGAAVYVVAPERALSPEVVATQAAIVDALDVGGGEVRYTLLVAVANIGGAPFNGTVEAFHAGAAVGSARLDLAARAQGSLLLEVRVPRNATGVVVAGLEVAMPGEAATGGGGEPGAAPSPGTPPPPPEQVPRTVAQVLEEKRQALREARAARGLSPRAFLEDVFANMEQSVTLVLLATFVHAGAGVVVAVLREARERAEVLEVLRHLGMGPEQLAARAARDALAAALPGLALGALLAYALLALLQPFGFPAAFGHTIPIAADAAFLARVAGGLALVAALAAAWSTRLPPDAPPRQAQPLELRELLGARA